MLFQHFYNSDPVQRLLRGGRAAERREEQAWEAEQAMAGDGGVTQRRSIPGTGKEKRGGQGQEEEHTCKANRWGLCGMSWADQEEGLRQGRAVHTAGGKLKVETECWKYLDGILQIEGIPKPRLGVDPVNVVL